MGRRRQRVRAGGEQAGTALTLRGPCGDWVSAAKSASMSPRLPEPMLDTLSQGTDKTILKPKSQK
jgi:hypothetical protein